MKDAFEKFEKDDFEIESTPEQLSIIHQLAVEQLRLEDEILRVETELKSLQSDLKKIEQGKLPDAIQQAGLSEIKTVSGHTVTIKEDLSVSVPKNKLNSIVAWLENNSHGDIVTGKIVVSLPKNSHNEKNAAIEALVAAGLEPVEETSVNTATLKSILRDHLKRGENIQLEDFGGFAWRKAIIKRSST